MKEGQQRNIIFLLNNIDSEFCYRATPQYEEILKNGFKVFREGECDSLCSLSDSDDLDNGDVDENSDQRSDNADKRDD